MIQKFKAKNKGLYEFILFNLMSNVATLTNFFMLYVGNTFLFKSLSIYPFHWFIFDYPVRVGGLGGMLSFLLAYVLAQTVNFIIQRKVVFNANVQVKKVLPWYVATVTIAGIISLWLPPFTIALLQPFVKQHATLVSNGINILIQVAINYPMMKYKIMKSE